MIAQQSNSVWQGGGKLENAGAWTSGEKILTFMQLYLDVLSLYLDDEKADKLTKTDHKAKNSNS